MGFLSAKVYTFHMNIFSVKANIFYSVTSTLDSYDIFF